MVNPLTQGPAGVGCPATASRQGLIVTAKRRPCGAGTGPGRAGERQRPRYQGHLARLDFRARTRCSAAWNAAWPKVPSW